ncbi:hypothetical protein PMZ80_004589 [Knufia obscura]|uniref:Pre-mRNA-splicing factor n=1 Tax=Knufia obscura TaxID=1635080 RepID=A0ABR0RSL9_9EURO|nr:hypothetical protein PMZ80_004589 [Knufia obscura]
MSNGAVWDELSTQWSSTLKRANPDLISKIWTNLEAESWAIASVAHLDSLQVSEKLLWPTFDESSSNQHALLLAVLLNYKKEARLLSWPTFTEPADRFSLLFRRVLSLALDPSTTVAVRIIILKFVTTAFQSLEQDVVRKECAPLVSIGIWDNLHSDPSREALLDAIPARRKAWRSTKKRFDQADQAGKLRMRLERAWLFNMLLDFLKGLNTQATSNLDLTYCARFLELLVDIVSQLPTRRYTIILLKDLNIVPLIRLSTMYNKKDANLIRDLTALLEQFCAFQIDDAGEVSTSRDTAHKQSLARLQKIALQNFESKLKVLALSNLATIGKPDELKPLLDVLSDLELEQLCSLLDLRTSYPPTAGIVTGRTFFLQILLSTFATIPDLHETMQRISVMPTERSLYDETLLRNESYTGSEPLALPKLNLQYLTLSDFLWRSFQLQQAEAFYEIRKDMESIVRKLKPQASRDPSGTNFTGFSKMAIPIDKPAIVDVAPPKVGETVPGHVRAEVVLDVGRLGDKVRSEWDGLKPKDTVFLLAVKSVESDSHSLTNGSAKLDTPQTHGIQLLRAAEVVQVQDEKGKPLRDQDNVNGYAHRGRTRRLLLDLDATAYQADKDRLTLGKGDVYKSINLVARRAGRENNFKPLLESIQKLTVSDARLPAWLQEVYLGYGQPSGATYPQIDEKISKIDFLDTFFDWDHLQESFPGKAVEHDGDHVPTPPYVLHLASDTDEPAPANPKKRRRDQMEEESSGAMKVSSYKPPNTGPYPIDQPKKNQVRFTPKQVQALVSGTQPGLSLIVGPPGTGKTDVATQLINLLYHNFPQERILLVAHSNQALNQLFQKIVALDIDPKHLLRLGHGEGDLDTEESFGKAGRVSSFMENRQTLLSEVNRLAASIGAEGAHGNSCETADYFNQVFIKPAWTRFWTIADAPNIDTPTISQAFPFKKFFSNAPTPDLFPLTASPSQSLETARGCQHHISRIFTQLESIRPFEILRHPRHEANHLLVHSARIIAMTSTHAAIRRSEIAALGFHYSTLIMEEAAQITEIESFIPCAMQTPDSTGESQLKRIVLIGDHLQNSPVIQNHALRDYANLEQSLFLRLIRLGVPYTTLDAQGRSRPSLTQLFSWRYPGLTSLPHTSTPQFTRANAGFAHPYQFIDVPDYQGQGEREPSPHFIQNLGEAECAVQLYMYMRLLGYPARNISILAAYAGQRALISDVLEHRCRGNKLFGMPRAVSTVDRYQGEQNDYVILSLVRTKTQGYLRDVRRLTVALSRARLGLYILGRRRLFEELPGLDIACGRGNSDGHLEVVSGEMYPTQRGVEDDVKSVEITGLEHLGQYVFEMTEAKVKSLGGNVSVMNDGDGATTADVDEEDAAEGEFEAEEVDPLHESVA